MSAEQAIRCLPRLFLPIIVSLALTACGANSTRSTQDGSDSRNAEFTSLQLSIVVSDESPAFVGVANSIAARLTVRPKIYNLQGNPARTAEVLRAIAGSDNTNVVAIGMVAANATRQLQGKRVIFCQVFNVEQMGLIAPWMRGVSALPPASMTLREWKKLDPTLKRVGVITGSGLNELMNEARAAARANGIQLTVATVRSDKEMLYAYKSMNAKIDGFWLMPDSRVLSREVLRDLMSYSVKQGKQVMVFAPELLQDGGLISVAGDVQDIATQVLARLKHAGKAPGVPGPVVTPLTKIRVEINPTMTKALGLKPPARYVTQ